MMPQKRKKIMKRFLDIVIFCLILGAIAIANQNLFGFSKSSQENEQANFSKNLNITEVLYSKELTPRNLGYAGHIPMAVGFGEKDVIKDIKILKNNETSEFLEQVLASGILNKWIGKDAKQAAAIKVDAVSGATISSTAIIKNMQAILDAKLGNKTPTKEPLNKLEIYKSLAILFVGLLGIFSFFVPKRTSKFRMTFAVLSIFVLGIWQGSMISIAKISAWFLHGIPDVFQIPLFLIFLASIIIPMITGKNFYCYHVCPFGAAQDLVSKSIRVNVKIKVYKWVQYIRFVMLLACFVMLLFGLGLYIANIEPFSAFRPELAPISAVIIFVVSLIVATFKPRFWCTHICPCGAFLDLFKKDRI